MMMMMIIALFQYNMDGSSVNEETVGHLRQRLNVMREICKVGTLISNWSSVIWLVESSHVTCMFELCIVE